MSSTAVPRRLKPFPQFLATHPHWSRSATYRRAPDHPGLLVKMGRATLIDLDIVDAIEAGLPDAVIKPDPRRTTALPAAPADAAVQPDPHRAPSPPAAPVVRRITAQPAAPIARARLQK